MEVQRSYGLRTRHLRRPRDSEHDAAADRDSPEAVAAIAVGLKPKSLTKQERQLFSSEISSYLELRWGHAAGHAASTCGVPLPCVLRPPRCCRSNRNAYLVQWYGDCLHLVEPNSITGGRERCFWYLPHTAILPEPQLHTSAATASLHLAHQLYRTVLTWVRLPAAAAAGGGVSAWWQGGACRARVHLPAGPRLHQLWGSDG